MAIFPKMTSSMVATAALGIVCHTAVVMASMSFWMSVKSVRYRQRVLSGPGVAAKFLDCMGEEWVHTHANMVFVRHQAYSDCIEDFKRYHARDTWLTLNGLALTIILMLAVTGIVHPFFLITSIVAVGLTAARPISASVVDHNLNQVTWLAIVLYRWNSESPVCCRVTVHTYFPDLIPLFEALNRPTWGMSDKTAVGF
jgi:hypothetical protein